MLILFVVKFIVLFSILFSNPVESWSLLDRVPRDPDDSKTIIELVESRGFQIQQHFITTEDGYILQIHRILNGNLSKNSSLNLKPVILQHGAYSSSADFCTNSPFLQSSSSKYGDTLAFSLLLTNRYDVWLPNFRGNMYSKQHVKLNPSDPQFWRFNLDDLSLKDLPAIIAYVRNKTNQEKVAYVGHSQGTFNMFELLSIRPEYADIIQPFIALAPIVFIPDDIKIFPFGIFRKPVVDGLYKFLMSKDDQIVPFPLDFFVQKFWNLICRNELSFCLKIISTSSHLPYLNYTRIGVYAHFIPTTISFKMGAHYLQLIRTGKFQRFNFGSKLENIKHYGQPEPPLIPLENIQKNAKIAFFSAIKDDFSVPRDVDYLRQFFHLHRIPLIKDYIVPNAKWTHFDFLFGLESGRYFIDEMINVLDQYVF